MKTPRFVVNEDPDPESATRAFRALRRMVRFGRLAERALREIEEKGFYDSRVPVIETGPYDSYLVETPRFPQRPDVNRADVPDPAKLQLVLGRICRASWGPGENLECSVSLDGPMLKQTGNRPRFKIVHHSAYLGILRFNKSSISWTISDRAYKVYRETKYAKVDDLYEMSRHIAKYLLPVEDGVSAKMATLRAALGRWLVEDGHIQRWMQELRDLAPLHQVQET